MRGGRLPWRRDGRAERCEPGDEIEGGWQRAATADGRRSPPRGPGGHVL